MNNKIFTFNVMGLVDGLLAFLNWFIIAEKQLKRGHGFVYKNLMYIYLNKF